MSFNSRNKIQFQTCKRIQPVRRRLACRFSHAPPQPAVLHVDLPSTGQPCHDGPRS